MAEVLLQVSDPSPSPTASHPPLDLTRHPFLPPSALLLQAVPSPPGILASLSGSRPASSISRHPWLSHEASCTGYLRNSNMRHRLLGCSQCLKSTVPLMSSDNLSIGPWPALLISPSVTLTPSSKLLLNPSVLPVCTWPFPFHVSKLRLSDMTSLNSRTPVSKPVTSYL